MAVFGIADLHLSLGTDKPMDVFRGWENYMQRLENNWRAVITDADTVVVAGDISWGMTLDGAREDFAFLHSLPGRKLLLKGNHDYWWTTRKKMDHFLSDCGFNSLTVVHNDAYEADGIAVCGTRGWFTDAEADQKVLLREVGRLRTSIAAAEATGLEPVVFLHYPPVFAGAACEEILQVLIDHRIRRCYYGHIHGGGIRNAVNGLVRGIEFRLISGDAVSFMPVLIR